MSALSRSTIIAALCACILISACGGPRVRNLYRDKSFDQNIISAGKFVIGGVTSIVGEQTEREIKWGPRDSLLWNQLTMQLEGVDILSPDYTLDALGMDQYNQILDDFEEYGELQDIDKAILAESFPDSSHYIIFARFDEDKVAFDQSESGESSSGDVTTTYTTFRRMGATFHVYSLPDCRLVWSGRIFNTEKTTNEYTEDDSGILGGIIESILFGDKGQPGYLDPPTLEQVGRDLFRKFGQALLESM